MDDKTRISTSVNGPLVIKNLNQLTESNGNIFPLKKTTVAFCRCGKSANKPRCDGEHRYAIFKDDKALPISVANRQREKKHLPMTVRQ